MRSLRFISALLAVVGLGAAPGWAKITIMALAPADTQFQIVLTAIRTELDSGYAVEVIDMSKQLSTGAIIEQCKKHGAQALILMDRKSILTAMDLQKSDSSFIKMPKFVYMTLMVEATTKGLGNVAGIKFEVPIYTLITNFRIISKTDFSKVGLFYRKTYERYIEEGKKLLDREQISLNAVCLDCENNKKSTLQDALIVMKKSFDSMVKDQECEAFLALADNMVVNNASLREFWLGKVKKKKLPIIAPLDIMASPQFALAVFTADPDLPQLGAQAAGQITEFFEKETTMESIGFEPTISIKSTVNQAVANDIGWKIKTEKLGRINKVIK